HMDDVLPNIQAVIPFRLTDECTVITRTTALLPSKSEIIGGASAIFQGRRRTADALGTWGVLPPVLALTVPGPGAVRTLANNVGSFAGAGPRKDVNQILIQPLVNYDLASDCHINSVPIFTADWKAGADDPWTLPTGPHPLDA